MAIKVTDKRIYSYKQPTDQERADGVVYQPDGSLAVPKLIDRDIECSSVRNRLAIDAGNVSITVVPGARLGELSINVQFEGKSGENSLCIREQEDLLTHAADWLEEILAGFGCDFEARIEAEPCAKTEARLAIERAAQRLEGVTVTATVSAGDRKVDRRATVETHITKED